MLISLVFFEFLEITSLDLSSFNTSSVETMCRIFRDSKKLTTIYVGSGWTMASILASFKCDVCGTVAGDYQMFTGCTKLVGAISYSSSKVNGTYANCETGYFTYKAKDCVQ